MGLPDILGNLKKALMDAVQAQAGKIGQDFVSDLSFAGGGSIVISVINGCINVSGKSLIFKITDKSNGKTIFEVDIPINANVLIPQIVIPLDIKGEFTK